MAWPFSYSSHRRDDRVHASFCTTAKAKNVVVVMGDDVGKWNIGVCRRDLMAGRTPNLGSTDV